MPSQQGQGHYPSKPPGNASAGPSGTQTSSQKLARSHSTEFGTGAGSQDPQQKAKVYPNG